MRKRRSQSRHVSHAQRWRRVPRRALRLAAFSVLLPVPVALAAPQATSIPTEQLVAMSQVPVSGVGDTVLPRVLPADALKAGQKGQPSASMTRLAKGKQAQPASPTAVAANGIPAAALSAYRTAEATMSIADPSCNLSWGLLAGIGQVESDHGRYAGAVLGQDGVSTPKILGLPLNGVGPVAAIADTDGGTMDGDKQWDRAVGPMQFIPSTWAMVGVDGDGDGDRNPHDIADAALASAVYLCAGEGNLNTAQGLHDAVFSYNHSEEYVALVTGVARAYESGIVDLPLLNASQVAPGPGVQVGLGNPGTGVMIGASDEVAPKGAKAGKKGAADKAAPAGKEDKAGPAGKEEKAGPADKGAKRTQKNGGDDSAGTQPERKQTQREGGSGGDTDDKTTTGGKKKTTPEGNNSGKDKGEPVEPTEPVETEDPDKSEKPEESDKPVEPTDPVEPEPEVTTETEYFVGHLTGDVDAPVLVLLKDGTELPLTVAGPVDQSWIDNEAVEVTVLRTTTTTDGEPSNSDEITDVEEVEAKED